MNLLIIQFSSSHIISYLCYELDNQGFENRQGREFFSSSPLPDWLWGPPSFLFNG